MARYREIIIYLGWFVRGSATDADNIRLWDKRSQYATAEPFHEVSRTMARGGYNQKVTESTLRFMDLFVLEGLAQHCG